jgi:hypothetical protein
MSNSVILFGEPELEFQYGQRVKDPRDGLSLFGAYDVGMPSQPRSISYVLIGTEEGNIKFRNWVKQINKPSIEAPNDNHRLWVPFPGFEAAFQSEFLTEPVWSATINNEKLIEASKQKDEHERTFGVVNQYLEEFEKIKKLDEKIGVAICVVPDEVFQNCRPKSHVQNGLGEKLSNKEKNARRSGQQNFFEEYNIEQYKLSPDFRRQLKARAMEQEIPIQIIRESTLKIGDDYEIGERRLTPQSDRNWNLATALYYKCGGKPWRLVSARDGVCYIGIAFRKANTDEKNKTACCAAQMFLNTGDGVVFLGEYGPWYSSETEQFHLTKDKAFSLLTGILKTYQDLGGKQLTEIFLHCRSEINDEEFEGYKKACPPNVKLYGVKVRSETFGFRLYRQGKMPVLRGTFAKINNRSGFLWASGFKPRIATYDGWEIPIPLKIEIQHGDASIERVAQDILGLTKLNYNACRLGESQPITVGFSDAVGEILISNPTIETRRPNFKYYI